MATQLPTYDYESEQTAIARKQKLLEAMMQGGLMPLEMPQQPGVKLSPLSGIAKIMQIMAAQKGIKTLDDDRARLAQRYNNDFVTGIQELDRGVNVSPASAQEVADESGGHAGPPLGVEGARKAKMSAVLKALSMNHPGLRDVAGPMLKPMLTQEKGIGVKELIQYATPESRQRMAMSGNVADFVPMPEYKAVGEQLLRLAGNGTPEVAYGPKFGPPVQQATGANGQPLIGQTKSTTGEIKWAPGGSNVTVNNAPENKAATAFATEAAKVRAMALEKSREKVQKLPGSLQRLDQAEGALKAGIKSGQLADIQLAFSKTFEAITGRQVDPTIANTEQFRAEMAQSVLAILQELRPASDKDVEYAKIASGADLKLSAQALQRLLNSARSQIVNDLLDHGRLVDRNSESPGADAATLEAFRVPFDLSMSADDFNFSGGRFSPRLPQDALQPGSSPQKEMTFEEYKQLYLNKVNKGRKGG